MQLTAYAQSLVDYVNTHTRYGEIGSHMFLDSCLAPNWRQMQAQPDAPVVGTWDGVEDDDE
ncbi:hypothetical protein ACRN97_12255 [Shewanella baltica]|uniref:hypothetical protein n=1 Tax=Shewanella baltica TaxID=62322 RepID=UPI00217ED50B|nr:hypothetical protein [Shewanella baltica]MCS6098742.1 hypothetical protein [Shewanella baltica]MCS6176741.1 hypothetical protein [Shewanella baltica]MCS6185421.1 hypothetical protein [Shewanella baltica]MCS6211256.1 hypothetical protein [Shewanella baltica]